MIKAYITNLIKLIIAISNANHFKFYKKIAYFILIILNSNKISSLPFYLIFKILYHLKLDKITFMLYEFNLLILSIRWINYNEMMYIRKLLSEDQQVDDEFRLKGFFKIDNLLNKHLIKEFIDKVKNANGYNSQVASQGVLLSQNDTKPRFISYSLSTELIFQEITKLFNRFDINKIKYIQNLFPIFNQKLYSVNFYRTLAFSDSSNLHYVQRFHRDYDGFNCYVLFLILSDVTKENGATVVKDALGNLHFLEGKCGDAYVMDPFLLHKANNSLKNDRYVMWIRFGEIPNLAYLQDLSFQDDISDKLLRLNNFFTKLKYE